MTARTANFVRRADAILKGGNAVAVVTEPQIGDTVRWIAEHREAKFEGVRGKEVTGKVLSVNGIVQELLVMPDYRLVPGAVFKNMRLNLSFEQLLSAKKGTTMAKLVKKISSKSTVAAKSEKVATKPSKKLVGKVAGKVSKVAAEEERAVPAKKPSKKVVGKVPSAKVAVKEPKSDKVVGKKPAAKPAKVEKVSRGDMTSAQVLRAHASGETVKFTRENFATLLRGLSRRMNKGTAMTKDAAKLLKSHAAGSEVAFTKANFATLLDGIK